MAERIKILVQKRTSLKAQITGLTNALDKGKIDNITLKLRIAHLTDVYHAYEEFHDELLVLDPSGDHLTEFTNVQDRYYTLASRIESILNVANTSDNNCDTASVGTRNDNASSVSVTKIRRMKLPEAPLPTFDGKFEEWLAFKNAFTNMIGNQTDLSDVDKLHYFKSALKGEAANIIKIFSVDAISYSSAWNLLVRAYKVKRILISRHLSMIVNLPTLEKENTSGLMADDVQQHVASLATLGVTVGPEMIVYLIESKLPRSALDKWEATLQRDEFPKPEQLYEFLYKIAVCASRREKAKISDTERCKGEPPAKKLRTGSSNKAFVAKVSRNCIACKVKRHPLYLCEKFKQLPVSERIEKIKSANLCYNCLRSHRGTPCKFSSCTICQK
ncbi:PREDICTED: uncharacterized protein LOC108778474 [Cyphomyrmex costatus]|uniref:uncharacterized protein LOC108778474 n=1 Tax=Cyphomyrmex costatus TaxID=456900 RepID=UPI00085243B0|nr:PREDICTED: uncharacterized protein LOC108778474 [Cyphomyrmex costatus]